MADYTQGTTIAAPATPPGRGGISVIRLSGPDSRRITAPLLDRPLPNAGSFRFCRVVEPDRQPHRIIDTAVVSYFPTPHSYTGEDVIEISLHGSPVVVSETLDLLYRQGAVPASPGEFTLRAFLNDRLDLAQAEAVADLINADSREAADYAMRQLTGVLSHALDTVSETLLRLISYCEIELDFSEEDVQFADSDEKLRLSRQITADLTTLLDGYNHARHLREGVKTAIIGPPNAGKSSLFNALLKDDRAIVHSTPGTTRDILTGAVVLEGIRFDLYDTAGVRETLDEIEDEGVRRAIYTANKADIIISVASYDTLTQVNIGLYGNAHIIAVINKTDINEFLPEGIIGTRISAVTGAGLDTLRSQLVNIAKGSNSREPGIINRERHYNAVRDALAGLNRASCAIGDNYPTEIIAEELRGALASLHTITGKGNVEDILGHIFGSFCIGK